METDDDGILRFDLDEIRLELDLMEAGARRGCLCSGCGSIATVANQVLLMAIAREWLNQQLRFAAARQGFTEGLEQACRLLGAGFGPLPNAVPPSVN